MLCPIETGPQFRVTVLNTKSLDDTFSLSCGTLRCNNEDYLSK
jgi:hypothetical protein